MRLLLLLLVTAALYAADYRAPAGTRPPDRGDIEGSILPGGRIVTPIGGLYPTGPGPFGLAISPSGELVVSANGGPNRYSLTVLTKGDVRQVVAPKRPEKGQPDPDDWHSVFMGLAFDGENELYASEGESGRIRVLDPRTGAKKFTISLNQGGFDDSYSGDLAFDRERARLYAVDQANFRVVAIDTKTRRILGSLRLGRLPFAIAMSADARHLYITNIGMFEYKALGLKLQFPAFGFPSAASRDGIPGIPGLGDPNVPESNSLAIVDAPNLRLESLVRTGLPFGPASFGGSSPSGVAVVGDTVFVSNGHNDSISAVDPASHRVRATIDLRIPGLETLRGILPIGLTYYEPEHWLLVAEAGINAIGIVDVRDGSVLGHVPADWFPTRTAVFGNTVYAVNAKGRGTGPNDQSRTTGRQGTISVFPAPERKDLASLTQTVLRNNGFTPASVAALALPAAIRHVVLIVKENRTFDEVFGDINGTPALARFGARVTPNHHALAQQFAISDNFYADSEVSVDGHHWLVGSYPNAWTESTLMASYGGEKKFKAATKAPGRLIYAESNSSVHPEELLEAGAIWHHLDSHGIPFRNYGEGFELAGVEEGPGEKPTGARYVTNVPMPDPLYRNTSRTYPQFNMNIPDQYRVTQFIAEVEQKYVRGGERFPRFVFIHLPNDHGAKVRPADGYPYNTSYMSDNDYALGRIVEYLSHKPWWREMAIFVTEDDAQGGVDHVDSHRTVLMVASPWARRHYVAHNNSSFPGLLKTVFRLLGLPPLNLYDAAATDLSDCFTDQPDYTPYTVKAIDKAIFDPSKVKDPLDPAPDSPRMDDPRVIRELSRR